MVIIEDGEKCMKNMYDVLQLLKKYQIFIYTGDRIADLDLMEMELAELRNAKILPDKEFLQATLIIRRERRVLLEK